MTKDLPQQKPPTEASEFSMLALMRSMSSICQERGTVPISPLSETDHFKPRDKISAGIMPTSGRYTLLVRAQDETHRSTARSPVPPSPRGRALLDRFATSPHLNNAYARENETQSCLLLKTLRGTKQSQFPASPHKVLEVPAEPDFEDSVPTSPGVGPRPSVGLVQWQTAERRACRSTRGPARAWDPPPEGRGSLLYAGTLQNRRTHVDSKMLGDPSAVLPQDSKREALLQEDSGFVLVF